ncbi:MAG: PD-(D/E)XK nuclease-like domain-containing protein [Phycisphaerae bacterium]|nr:PD-(D/E)XK nuclease-like domain-containing protein [Phycisphaerae bacterium]
MSTRPHQPPLVSTGQGDYRRDLYPEDFGMPANTDTIDLRFLIREPADVYHAKGKDYLSSHALNEFRRCPLLYRKRELGLVPERDSTAFLIGRAAHTLILEGRQRYEREYAIGGPINPKTGQPFGSQTKAFAEWAEAQSKPVLSDAHAALVEQMAAAVREHPVARDLFAAGVAEGVVRGPYLGFTSQARIDWINPAIDIGIVDLKTADDLDSFEFALRALGYVHQLAFYRAMVAIGCGRVLPVHVVAVEKREPFRCGVWQISPAALDQSREQNEEAMRELRRCRSDGDWFTRFEEMRVVERL